MCGGTGNLLNKATEAPLKKEKRIMGVSFLTLGKGSYKYGNKTKIQGHFPGTHGCKYIYGERNIGVMYKYISISPNSSY